jgi:hypothetical protein
MNIVKKSLLAVAAALAVAGAAQAGPLLYLSTTSNELGTVDSTTGTVSLIGSTGVFLSDIAFDATGQLWGISFSNLYKVDKNTGASTLVGSMGSVSGTANALVFGAGGTLYMAGNTLYTLNTSTGAASAIGAIGSQSAGDLAFVGGTLYMAAASNNLVAVDTATGAGTVVGAMGVSDVFGLATPDNVNLFGVAGTDLLSINTTTGAASVVAGFTPTGVLRGAAAGSAFFAEAGAVPVPATYGLVALGLFAAFAARRRS